MHLLILPCPASTLPCNPRLPCLFHSAARSQQSQLLVRNYLIKNQLQTHIPLLLWPYFKGYDLPLHFNSICLSKNQCCEPSCLPAETTGLWHFKPDKALKNTLRKLLFCLAAGEEWTTYNSNSYYFSSWSCCSLSATKHLREQKHVKCFFCHLPVAGGQNAASVTVFRQMKLWHILLIPMATVLCLLPDLSLLQKASRHPHCYWHSLWSLFTLNMPWIPR